MSDAGDLDHLPGARLGAALVPDLAAPNDGVCVAGVRHCESSGFHTFTRFLTLGLQFLFNNLVNPPVCVRPGLASVSAVEDDEERALLREEALEETATLPADLGASGYDVVPQATGVETR